MLFRTTNAIMRRHKRTSGVQYRARHGRSQLTSLRDDERNKIVK